MIEFSAIARLGLLLVRPGAVVAMAPGFGSAFALPMVKVALTVLLAVALAPAVVVPDVSSDVSLTLVIARELAIGLALGITVQALVASAEMAGHLAGYQIGFSYAATIDPASGVRNSVVSSLYGMLALLTFLGVNGHHDVVRALVASYQTLPVGAGHVSGSLVASVGQTLGLVLTVGLRLAAPLVLALVVVEVALGLVARSAPAMNLLVIGYPVRLVAGLVVLALVVGVVPGVIGGLVDRAVALGLRLAGSFS